MLEHIPRLSAALGAIDRYLAPSVQVHITPWVDPPSDDVVSVVGREHPLGVTFGFWRRHAAEAGQIARIEAHRAGAHGPFDETLALLADPRLVSSTELAAISLPDVRAHENPPAS